MCTNKLFQVTAAHSYTHPFNGCFPGLLGRAGTRKIKPIWILLKQATVSGSGISWAYASLQLAPDRQPHQHPTTQFCTGPSCRPTNSIKALKAHKMV